MIELPVLNRVCGDCQACCEWVAVREFMKPEREKCKHQCANGCSIYESRPNECKQYHCSWLAYEEYIPLSFRPDVTGLFMESIELHALNGERLLVLTMAWEMKPNAMFDIGLKELNKLIVPGHAMLVFQYGSVSEQALSTPVPMFANEEDAQHGADLMQKLNDPTTKIGTMDGEHTVEEAMRWTDDLPR